MCMAQTELDLITQLFQEEHELSEDEDELVCQIGGLTVEEQDISSPVPIGGKSKNDINCSSHGFVTPVVGDVGTCKINNAAMNRSSSYRWVGLCPGELHNKGYYYEAVFKVHGSNGMHYLILEIMKRKKLIANAFKKFQDGNLLYIREAIRDVSKAYGMGSRLRIFGKQSFPFSK